MMMYNDVYMLGCPCCSPVFPVFTFVMPINPRNPTDTKLPCSNFERPSPEQEYPGGAKTLRDERTVKLLGRRFLFLRLLNSVAATASHGKDVAFAESRIRGETIAAEDDVRVVAVHTAGTGYFDCRRIDWQNCVSSQVEVRLCSASACKITQVYGNMFVE